MKQFNTRIIWKFAIEISNLIHRNVCNWWIEQYSCLMWTREMELNLKSNSICNNIIYLYQSSCWKNKQILKHFENLCRLCFREFDFFKWFTVASKKWKSICSAAAWILPSWLYQNHEYNFKRIVNGTYKYFYNLPQLLNIYVRIDKFCT